MMIFLYIFLAVLGLVIGSFVAAYTYRATRGISIAKGRSFCDQCKKQIKWYDNIPVFSYLFLKGRCRNCHTKISPRYPFIETCFMVGFILIGVFQTQIFDNVNIPHTIFSLAYLLIIFSISAAIFAIDLESQFIPDELNFSLFGLAISFLLITSNNNFFTFVFSGFVFALFFLLLNLFTNGRGMGLGDVKFVIFPGLFLGPNLGTIWLFLSFILGALVGVFLITIGKAKLGRHIPFGPFLVISLVIVSLFGNIIRMKLFP